MVFVVVHGIILQCEHLLDLFVLLMSFAWAALLMRFFGRKGIISMVQKFWIRRVFILGARLVGSSRRRHVRFWPHRKATRFRAFRAIRITRRWSFHKCGQEIFQQEVRRSLSGFQCCRSFCNDMKRRGFGVLRFTCVLMRANHDRNKQRKLRSWFHKKRRILHTVHTCGAPTGLSQISSSLHHMPQCTQHLSQCKRTPTDKHATSSQTAQVICRYFLGGGKPKHDSDDLLAGLQKLLAAQSNTNLQCTRTGELLQALKALVRKAEYDADCDLLSELRSLVQVETRKRNQKHTSPVRHKSSCEPQHSHTHETKWWSHRPKEETSHSTLDEWHEMKWNLCLSDWDTAMTNDIGVFKSIEALRSALDEDTHEAYIIHMSCGYAR